MLIMLWLAYLLVLHVITCATDASILALLNDNCSLSNSNYLVIGGTSYIGSSIIKQVKHFNPAQSVLLINHKVMGGLDHLRYDDGSYAIDIHNDIQIGDLGNIDFIRKHTRCASTIFHVLEFTHMSSYKKQLEIHRKVLKVASESRVFSYIEIDNLFCSNLEYLKEYDTNIGSITRASAMNIKVFRVFNVFGRSMYLGKGDHQKYTIPQLIKQALTSLSGLLPIAPHISLTDQESTKLQGYMDYIYIDDLMNKILHYHDNIITSTSKQPKLVYHSLNERISYLNTLNSSAGMNMEMIARMVSELTNYVLRYSGRNIISPCSSGKYHSVCSNAVSHSHFLPDSQYSSYNNLTVTSFIQFKKALVQVFIDVSSRTGRYLMSMKDDFFEDWTDEYGIAHAPFLDWIDRLERYRISTSNGRIKYHYDIELDLLDVLDSKSISSELNSDLNLVHCADDHMNNSNKFGSSSPGSRRKRLIFQQYEEESVFFLPYYRSYIRLLSASYDICRCGSLESCIADCSEEPSDVYLIGQSIMNKVKYSYFTPYDFSSLVKNSSCIAVFLNKEYEALEEKLSFINEINASVAFTHHHNITEYAAYTHIPFIRIPFATDVKDFNAFSHLNAKLFPYLYDISTSGHNFRVPWRLWYNNTGIQLLNSLGIHAAVSGWAQNISEYVKNVALSKMWVATLSEVDLVPTRVYDVMATNRSLLFLNRPTDARVLRGIVSENQHCVLFSTNDEFVEKVIYYSTHESERLQIVQNAYENALHHHDWTHRSKLILDVLEKCPKKHEDLPYSEQEEFSYMDKVYFINGTNYKSKSKSNITISTDGLADDLSWLEYLKEVYEIQTVDGTEQMSVHLFDKQMSSFFYNHAKVKIKIIDEFPIKHFTYLTKDADSYRIAFNSNAKLESNSWVEVSRFGTNTFNRNWYEGYSEGNSYMSGGEKIIKVPYGCWFYPSPGSGIFVNVGKLLFINDTINAWKNEFKISGMSENGCMRGDKSINCFDKYYCTAALSLGYDSFYSIEEIKHGNKYRYPQLVICHDSCSTVSYNGACPPLDFRAYSTNSRNSHSSKHYDNIKSISSNDKQSIQYLVDHLVPCKCNEESHILNCDKSFQFPVSVSNTLIDNSYRHTACVSYGAGLNAIAMKPFRFKLISSFNSNLSIKELQKLHEYSIAILIQRESLFVNTNYISTTVTTVGRRFSISRYLRLDLIGDQPLQSYPINSDDTSLTEIKLNEQGILDIIKLDVYDALVNDTVHIGLIVFKSVGQNDHYLMDDMKRQLIDAAMCLYTSGASLIILIIIPSPTASTLYPKQSKTEIISKKLSLALEIKEYIHMIIVNSIDKQHYQELSNQILKDRSSYNSSIINLSNFHYSIATVVKTNVNEMYITNENTVIN